MTRLAGSIQARFDSNSVRGKETRMRFGRLNVGEKFVSQIGNRLYAFRKKSLSSAYVIDVDSMAPVLLTVSFARCDKTGSIMGFSAAAEVHPLL